MNRVALPALLLLAACGANTPIESSTDCTGFGAVEIWQLSSPELGSYTIRVDTVATETAFDPAVTIGTGFNTSSTDYVEIWTDVEIIASGDDEFDCTFPPPEYQCPSASFTIEDATMAPMIAVENLGSCATEGGTATYVLSVEKDGKAVSVEMLNSVTWTESPFPDTGGM